MATMREVAAQAGVSLKTVSRVFNGDTHVSPEVRQRVQAALEATRYVPNELAQVFRSGRSRVVGVAVPDLLDPFYGAIVAAVDARVKQQGYSTLVTAAGFDSATEQENVFSLLGRNVAGLILAPGATDQGYLDRSPVDVPVVSVDQLTSGAASDAFLHDDGQGAILATEHLLGHGFDRVGFVGREPRLASMQDRLAGYREALATAGFGPDAGLVAADVDSADDVSAALARLRERGADAVFLADPRTTIACLPGLLSDPLAAVGFGDFPLADLLRPSITVIDQDPARMGTRAAERVLERIASRGESAPDPEPDEAQREAQVVRLPVRLIERESCRTRAPRP